MKRSSPSYVGLCSLLLVTSAAFTACGGLDSRQVTRGPDEPVAGAATDGGSGNSPGSGGSDATVGGAENKPNNPFGGDTFAGGAPPVVDGPPEVLEVDPVDGADDGDPDKNVSLLFSEGLDDATVTADNVKIMDGDTEVEGDLTYSGVVATFAPAARLSLLASYDVSVSQGVTDIGGQALKEPFSSSFTVRDGVWGKPTSAFAEQDLWYGQQDSGIDARGNTLVVWSRNASETDSTVRIVARWYRAATGWQKEVTLNAAGSDCLNPRVAVSSEGDAAVTWFCWDVNGYLRPFARRFVDGDWEASALDVAPLSTDIIDTNYALPVVAIGGGQVVVSWIGVQYQPLQNTYYYTLQTTATTSTGAWPSYSSPQAWADGTYDQVITSLSATMDAKGNAIVTYGFGAATTADAGVYYLRKAATSSWQPPAKIPNSIVPEWGPLVVSDGDGAMATWVAYDPLLGAYQVLASRYTKAKKFAAPIPIGDPDLIEAAGVSDHGLASDGKSFFATWGQQVGTSANAYASRYDIATGEWDALPSVVSDGDASAGFVTSIGVDGHGNALVVFDQVGSTDTQIMYARFAASDGAWQGPRLLAEDGHGYNEPILAVAKNGVSSVVFWGGGRGSSGVLPTLGGQLRLFK